MKPCPLCGAKGVQWHGHDNLPAWRQSHIDELCYHCNRRYTDYYLMRFGSRGCYGDAWENVRRDEVILTEFISNRLQALAARYKKGLPITRCEAMTRGFSDRCPFFWKNEIDGHKMCASHSHNYRMRRLITFSDDDGQWLQQVQTFFRDKLNITTGEAA